MDTASFALELARAHYCCNTHFESLPPLKAMDIIAFMKLCTDHQTESRFNFLPPKLYTGLRPAYSLNIGKYTILYTV